MNINQIITIKGDNSKFEVDSCCTIIISNELVARGI